MDGRITQASQRFTFIRRAELGGWEGEKTPHGTDPQITETPDGIIIAWSDGKRREQRRLPAGTVVTWHDGAFRVGFHKDMPQPRGAGA